MAENGDNAISLFWVFEIAVHDVTACILDGLSADICFFRDDRAWPREHLLKQEGTAQLFSGTDPMFSAGLRGFVHERIIRENRMLT